MLRGIINLCRSGVIALAVVAGPALAPAAAQDVTLRIHHFLSPQAPVPARFIAPWAQKVEAESGGRIKFEIYPAMQLGGAPPDLYDQARDGVVDIVWTLPGYAAGRFPRSEAFELPFMPTTGEATSRALWTFFDKNLREEFGEVHVIAAHVHGAGLLHMRGEPVARLEDLRGKRVRGPTRAITRLLGALGATAVGMPVPQVPESLSRGVIDGAVLPWEVTTPLRVAELVDSHTDFAGDRGLYTSVFVFAMNRASYERLPDDLRAIIDANSGLDASAWAGRAMDEGDAAGIERAQARGNRILRLDEEEAARWREASSSVVDTWIAEMDGRGVDGRALYEEALALIAANAPAP